MCKSIYRKVDKPHKLKQKMFPTPTFLDSKPEARDYELLRCHSDTRDHDQNASSSHFPTTNNNSQFCDQKSLQQHQTMHTSLPSRTNNGLSRPSIVERSATANSLLTDDGEDVVYQPQNDHPFLACNAGAPRSVAGQRDPAGVSGYASPKRMGQPSNPLMGPAGAPFSDGMYSRRRTNVSNAESSGFFAGDDSSRLGFPSMRSQDELFHPRVPLRAAAAAAIARNQAEHQNASLKMLSAAVSAKKRWALQEQDVAIQRRKRARMEALMKYGGLVEARPGKFVRMVGTERARKAIARGKAKVVKCQVCENSFQVHRRARVLYCKGCQHFSPLVPELEAFNSNKKRASVLR